MAPKLSKPCRPGHVICSSCKQEKPEQNCKKVRNEDVFHNRGEQHRCDDCNNVKSRLHRLKDKGQITDGYHGFEGDDRASFMQKASSLYGTDLAKLVTETEAVIIAKSSKTKFKETGQAHPLTEVEEMPRFKKFPDQLEKLKESCPPWQCPKTGAWMIEVPSYERTKEDEEVEERSSKRKIEAETNIKAAKKPKPPVDLTGDEKAVPDSQKKKIEKVKGELEKGTLDLNTQLTVAKAPDNKDNVPNKLITKADTAKVDLERVTSIINGIMEKNTAPKGLIAQTIEESKEALKMARSLTEQIQGGSAKANTTSTTSSSSTSSTTSSSTISSSTTSSTSTSSISNTSNSSITSTSISISSTSNTTSSSCSSTTTSSSCSSTITSSNCTLHHIMPNLTIPCRTWCCTYGYAY